MNNAQIAEKLLAHARELEAHGHNLYRVRAYRRAALSIRMLAVEVSELLEQGGRAALATIPGVGAHLAFTLERLLRRGEWVTLGPGPEETDPRQRLTSLPGVGPRLALRLREELGIETLAQLEEAAREGRLEVVGIGPGRVQVLLTVLEARRGKPCRAS